MPSGRKTALTIHLTSEERQTLLAWQRAPTLSAGMVRRGRIILLVSEGTPITEIARAVGISRHHIYKWVQRFLAQGLEGLVDKPGRGPRWPRPSPREMPPDVCPRGTSTQGQ